MAGILLELVEHPGYQKAQDDVETGHLEKAVCLLLLVHGTLQPAPHTLGNVPLDGAGLDVKVWDCVPVQVSLPPVTPPLWGWKERMQ